MGWSPYEYYTSSPYEFFCACEGYFIKLNNEAHLHRASAFIIYRTLGGKENLDKIWPMKTDTKPGKVSMDEDMWSKIKQAHGIK